MDPCCWRWWDIWLIFFDLVILKSIWAALNSFHFLHFLSACHETHLRQYPVLDPHWKVLFAPSLDSNPFLFFSHWSFFTHVDDTIVFVSVEHEFSVMRCECSIFFFSSRGAQRLAVTSNFDLLVQSVLITLNRQFHGQLWQNWSWTLILFTCLIGPVIPLLEGSLGCHFRKRIKRWISDYAESISSEKVSCVFGVFWRIGWGINFSWHYYLEPI